jgi:hypothetical protein
MNIFRIASHAAISKERVMNQRSKVTLLFSLLLLSTNAFSNCIGYAGPGGPCYTGPGGGLYTGPGGGAYTGPGGGAYTGPGVGLTPVPVAVRTLDRAVAPTPVLVVGPMVAPEGLVTLAPEAAILTNGTVHPPTASEKEQIRNVSTR